ncbi:hypothetical protein [Aureliella helgolandensis]|uniref:Uncharacterized protein n=1 Tax=Aureliella helgolandensis TaxID=2527968 RepID=A0A518GDH5_9BACT|nr:hypothetical protein [Aureliella helgolandensis]QDV26643.1 hypothetical protein Q31a_50190 [Aureliella helgolandensis]
MPKIHYFSSGQKAVTGVAHQTLITLFGIGLVLASANASAQTVARAGVPALQTSAGGARIPDSMEGTSASMSDMPTVGSAYSLTSDASRIEPASYFPSAGFGSRATQSDPCYGGCDVRWYASYEALWLTRENDERFSLSLNSNLPDWDYDFGGRYTVGSMMDCVSAWEFVYAGPFDWQRSASVAGAGVLQSRFFPHGGFTAANVTGFNDADQHVQNLSAELHSFEVNRRWHSWDALSTMIGFRYIDYDEDYVFQSLKAGGTTGFYADSLENQMLGGQIGADVLYPVSLRGSVGFRGKAGVYANFEDRSTYMTNEGVLLLNGGDDHVELAGLIEGGVIGNYQIVPSIRLTAGYEFWYVPGAATIAEQTPAHVHPGAGFSIENESDLFLHGGSLGLQVLF